MFEERLLVTDVPAPGGYTAAVALRSVDEYCLIWLDFETR
jgi:hypothetical protein